MKFLFVVADTEREWNCSEWRVAIPARTINKSEHHSAALINWEQFGHFEKPEVQDRVGPCDVIMYQRNLFCEPYLSAVEYWQGLGKAVILDLDDAYPILPWSNPAHGFWIQDNRKLKERLGHTPLEGLENGAQLVDAVSSPSKLICRDWSRHGMVLWIPNFPQGEWYEDLPGKPDNMKDRIVIGWGGSISHYDGFWLSGVRQALTNVCQRHPEVLFKFCGNDGRIYFQLPIGTRNKVWQQGVPPAEWPKVISTFDIGIAPMDLVGPYESRKSWLKGAEYLLAKVPWIASDCPSYQDLREHGHLIGNSPAEWEAALEDMIANLDREKERAAAEAYEFGLSLTMENNVGYYVQCGRKVQVLRQARVGLPGVLHVGTENPRKPIRLLEDVIHVGT